MADEIKKNQDEIVENAADIREGAISDDAVETVAGGFRLTSENAEDVRKGANDQFRELKNKTFGWP